MNWQDHLTPAERATLEALAIDRHHHRQLAADIGQQIARLRNTCVNRARRSKHAD